MLSLLYAVARRTAYCICSQLLLSAAQSTQNMVEAVNGYSTATTIRSVKKKQTNLEKRNESVAGALQARRLS